MYTIFLQPTPSFATAISAKNSARRCRIVLGSSYESFRTLHLGAPCNVTRVRATRRAASVATSSACTLVSGRQKRPLTAPPADPGPVPYDKLRPELISKVTSMLELRQRRPLMKTSMNFERLSSGLIPGDLCLFIVAKSCGDGSVTFVYSGKLR